MQVNNVYPELLPQLKDLRRKRTFFFLMYDLPSFTPYDEISRIKRPIPLECSRFFRNDSSENVLSNGGAGLIWLKRLAQYFLVT